MFERKTTPQYDLNPEPLDLGPSDCINYQSAPGQRVQSSRVQSSEFKLLIQYMHVVIIITQFRV